MADIINSYQYNNSIINKYPVIHCESNKTDLAGISINKILALELIKVNPKRRSLRMTRIIFNVLSDLPKGSVIKDFDVVFNPAYDIDVLKIFIEIRKNLSFEIIWPGEIENGKLIYGQKECEDYKIYDLEKYDVTCII